MDNPNSAIPRLSRHGLLMYRLGQQYLGTLDPKDLPLLEKKISESDAMYWYWDRGSDQAIYA